jgi:hypothetical protein
MVLFCNAIQQADSTDLKSLTDFVTSLESCRHVSEGAEKLYKMCLLFLKVARFYIQAKTQESAARHAQFFSRLEQPDANAAEAGFSIDLNTIAQFDPHLNALGLVSNPTWPMLDYSSGLSPQTQGSSTMNVESKDEIRFSDSGMGHDTISANQNSVQDWFLGSRYLINFMDVGNDLRMPDMNDMSSQ